MHAIVTLFTPINFTDEKIMSKMCTTNMQALAMIEVATQEPIDLSLRLRRSHINKVHQGVM